MAGNRTSMLTRRAALQWFGSGAAVALLAACAPAPAQPTASGAGAAATTVTVTPAGFAAATATESAEQPRSGGSVKLGFLGGLPTLDGHFPQGWDTSYRVWDRLVVQDEQLNPQPMLAESWDVSSDWRSVRLTLRKGVQWHSGRELTSDDVLWNFHRAQDPKVAGGIFANFLRPLSSIEAPDKYNVVLKSEQGWPGVFDPLQLLNILDPVSMQQPDGLTNPIGTGAFRFAEYVQGDHLRLVKNPDYWKKPLPYVDELNFPIFSDAQTMVSQLEAGALDAVSLPALRDAVRLQKDNRFQVLFNQLSGAHFALVANTTTAPTNNKLFRQALNYAIDRQRIIDSILLGIGTPLNLPWYPSSPAYDASKNLFYKFDLDKARGLVQQSGVGDPSLDFNYSVAVPEYASIGQIFKQDLAKIGVTLTLKPTDPVLLTNLTYSVKYQGLLSGQGLFGHLHPGLMSAHPYYSPVNNNAGFTDEKYTQLANTIATETDPAKQKPAYAQWNDFVLDQSHIMAYATSLPRSIASVRVRGLAYNMAYMLDSTAGWLA